MSKFNVGDTVETTKHGKIAKVRSISKDMRGVTRYQLAGVIGSYSDNTLKMVKPHNGSLSIGDHVIVHPSGRLDTVSEIRSDGRYMLRGSTASYSADQLQIIDVRSNSTETMSPIQSKLKPVVLGCGPVTYDLTSGVFGIRSGSGQMFSVGEDHASELLEALYEFKREGHLNGGEK